MLLKIKCRVVQKNIAGCFIDKIKVGRLQKIPNSLSVKQNDQAYSWLTMLRKKCQMLWAKKNEKLKIWRSLQTLLTPLMSSEIVKEYNWLFKPTNLIIALLLNAFLSKKPKFTWSIMLPATSLL